MKSIFLLRDQSFSKYTPMRTLKLSLSLFACNVRRATYADKYQLICINKEYNLLQAYIFFWKISHELIVHMLNKALEPNTPLWPYGVKLELKIGLSLGSFISISRKLESYFQTFCVPKSFTWFNMRTFWCNFSPKCGAIVIIIIERGRSSFKEYEDMCMNYNPYFGF